MFKLQKREIKNQLNYLLLLLLLLSSLLVLIKIPVIDIAVYNFLYPLWTGLLIAINFKGKLIFKHIEPLLFLLTLFTWCVISSLFSEYKITALTQIVKYANYGISFIALLLATGDRKSHLGYYKLIINFLSIIGFLGIVEYLVPDFGLFAILVENSFYPRVTSVMQNPNPFGILMAIAAILTIIIYQKSSFNKKLNTLIITQHNFSNIISFAIREIIFIMAISCSGSRNSWLVLIIGLSLLIYYQFISLKSIAGILILLLLVILLIPVSKYRLGLGDLPTITSLSFIGLSGDLTILQLPSPQGTAFSRILLWKRAISEIIDRPIFGLGLGVFNQHISEQVFGKSGFNTHNFFLETLVDLGFPGLLIVTTGIVKLFRKISQCDRLIFIILILFLISQSVDFFLHDFTFTTIEILFIAIALNSRY